MSLLRAAMNGMTHQGCALDDPQRALALGTMHGWRLIVASLRDDDATTDQTLDEVEGCSECLRGLVQFLAGSTASAFAPIAGGDGQAIARAEQLVAKAIEETRGT
jgi:hypothetical protein